MPEQKKPGGRVYHRAAQPRKRASRTFGESADWSDHEGCEALYTNRPANLLRCLRPGQWPKNLILLAAPFFACFDKGQRIADPVRAQEDLGLALVAFVLLSAYAYVLNDLADAKADARNPLKRLRPIAARQVSFGAAIPLGALCLAGGLAAAWYHGWRAGGGHALLWLALGYALLQPAYTFAARRVVELGAAAVALGFALRAAAGAVAVGVRLSPWLLVCAFLLTFFVALCKRRAAHFVKGLPQPTAAESRILDLEIGVAAAATAACYALYTLATETIANFGTDRLVWTVPLVLLGLFRFLRLTYGERGGGAPDAALLRDWPTLGILALWVAACAAILATA